MTVVFSDLHLRESSADTCFAVLDYIFNLARQGDGQVVFCGDWWHIRYQVDVRLLNRLDAELRRWQEAGVVLDIVPGNHDQVDTSGANALEVFHRDSVAVWTEPGIDTDNGWGFVPYRKDPEDLSASIQAVANEEPSVIFAHFAVKGAVMNNGRKDDEGVGFITGDGIPVVLGHYHKHQQGVGWQYVGSPYQTSYGEAGNVCGCLVGSPGAWKFHPIDVGAPRHFILKWDPAKQAEPPAPPADCRIGTDHVRLDIEATQEQIVSGKFKTVLKQSGLEDVQVNVKPVTPLREVKLELGEGETLLQAAERFAEERLDPKVGESASSAMEAQRSDGMMVPGPHNPTLDVVMESLRRWVDG